MPANFTLQVRHDVAATWTSVNPTLAAGEWGIETDTLKIKIGNGSQAWTALAYAKVGTADLATVATTSTKITASGMDRKVFVSSTEPATGMVAGDIWIKA